MVLPREISWRIPIPKHRTRCNSPKRSKRNLKSTPDCPFRGLDNIVLCKRECGRLIWICPCDGKECTKEFDTIGDRVGSHEGETDDCDDRVEKDEWGSVVDFIGPVGSAEGDNDGENVRWGDQDESDWKREPQIEENDGNKVCKRITRGCGTEELASVIR